jgi:hypothetical protein
MSNPEPPLEDDLLRGAAEIGEHLRAEGLDVKDGDVYYIARTGKLAIGRFGKQLLASKRRLSRDIRRAAQAIPTM